MKIISIIGARPQFVKAAIVSKRIKELAPGIEEKLVHTGQHYDFNMSEVFFQELGIPEPVYHLAIGSGTHGAQTGKMLEKIEDILLTEKPDLVMVYGDTNTTLAGSLAAAKLHIPVAHIEAGLRSFNKQMPEEINRILTDHVSDFLFSPTKTGLKNLKKEGFTHIYNSFTDLPADIRSLPRPLCINVGDVMLDIALEIKKNVNETSILKGFNLEKKNYILATIHRADNTDTRENLEGIFQALLHLAKNGNRVFFPIHPRTRKALETFGLLDNIKQNLKSSVENEENFILAEPVSYSDMIALENNAKLIITDSGGVQKEAYFFNTPCLITRDETEWVELVESGWTIITGAEFDKIIWATDYLLNKQMQKTGEALFGNGNAAGHIAHILKKIGRD